jgi:hypothetical protein
MKNMNKMRKVKKNDERPINSSPEMNHENDKNKTFDKYTLV